MDLEPSFKVALRHIRIEPRQMKSKQEKNKIEHPENTLLL
jgi:hypothetical protein